MSDRSVFVLVYVLIFTCVPALCIYAHGQGFLVDRSLASCLTGTSENQMGMQINSGSITLHKDD